MDKIDLAKARAIKILAEYGITNWGIKITNSRKELAAVLHRKRRLEISKRFIAKATIEDFDGIMRHEVAHILVGPGKGHGYEFVEMCNRINPDERFSCDNYPIYIGLWLYTCPNCGVLGSKETKKNIVCDYCLSQGLVVDLEVAKNEIVPVQWASTP